MVTTIKETSLAADKPNN